MKLNKTIIALTAAGGLALALAMPASAQSSGHGKGGHGGYVPQNQSGYSGGGHNSGGHGQRPPSGSYGGNGHGSWQGNSNQNGYRGGGHDRDDHRDSRPSYGGHNSYGSHNSYNGYYGQYRPAPPPAYYRPRYTYNPRQTVIYSPSYINDWRYRSYQPRYRVGNYLSLSSQYYINDYTRYGLYQPPQGYYWVRQDNDAYLAAAGTGLIAGIIIGALAAN